MFSELLSDLRFRLRALFHRGDVERELDDELRFHIDREAEKLRAEGIASDEAMRRAHVAFGGVENAREESRDIRGLRWVEIIYRDLRAAARSLRAQPGFTAIAVASIAIGISISAGVIATYDGVYHRALGFPNADRVVALYSPGAYSDNWSLPRASVEAVGHRATRLSPVVGFYSAYSSIQGDGWSTWATVTFAPPTFFSLLGVRAELGRVLTTLDSTTGAPRTAVISHDLWVSRFGADTGVIGKMISVDYSPYQIVGVLSRRAAYPSAFPSDAALWSAKSPTGNGSTSVPALQAIAGLRPSTPVAAASAEVTTITQADQHTQTDGRRREVLRVAPLRTRLGDSMVLQLVLTGVLGIFVALVAFVNFATLTLARGMRRRAELGIRAALGASFPRLVSHLIAEAVTVSAAGGLLGALLAPVVVRWIPSLSPPWMDATWSVYESAIAVALAVTLGILFGLEPAFALARPAIAELIASVSGRTVGERRLRSTRRSLVGWQVFLAVGPAVFIFTALSHGMTNLGQPETGYDQANLVIGSAELAGPDIESVHRGGIRILNEIDATRGVVAASLVEAGYLVGPLEVATADLRTSPTKERSSFQPVPINGVSWNQVTPQYFATVGLKLVAGRVPTPDELSRGAPIAVVSASAAQALVGQRAIGWRLRLLSATFTVVGIVADVSTHPLEQAPTPTVFTAETWIDPTATRPKLGGKWEHHYATVFVRSRPGERNVIASLYATQRTDDSTATLSDLELLSAHVERENRGVRRAQAIIVTLFGLALAMAAVGIYGMMAYSAATRRREFAVRSALGACPAGIALLVVREASTQAAIGFAFGVLGGVLGGRFFLTQPGSPPPPIPVAALVAITAALMCAVLISCVAPIRRVWRLDTASALREDG